MSNEHDLDQARWAALLDREAVGEPLDDHERAFVRRYEADRPELAGERAVFEGALESLHRQLEAEEPDEVLEAAAAAALARYRRGDGRGPGLHAVGSAPRSRGWTIAVVATLTAAAGAALWIGLARSPSDPAPRLTSTSRPTTSPSRVEPAPTPEGPAPLDPRATLSMVADESALALGEAFPPGHTSEAVWGEHPPGRACLSWTDPVAVVCFEGSLRSIASSDPSERRLRLDDGRLIAALAPLGPGQRFTVETPSGAATAIGTVFAVEVHEGQSWLTVLEGKVELHDPATRHVVAGQRTNFRAEVPGDAPSPLVADEIPTALTELVGYAELLRGRPGPATLAIPNAAELGVAGLVLDRRSITGPAQLTLSPGPHTIVAYGDDGATLLEHRFELGGGDPVDLAGELDRALAELAPARPSKPASPRARSLETAKQLAEAAQQARKQRDYVRTAALYRELLDRYPDSPEAANVPVRLGDLLAARNDPAGALAAYQLYLDGDGKQLRPEAEYGRIRALQALGRASEADRAIAAFLAARPDDYRSAELRAGD